MNRFVIEKVAMLALAMFPKSFAVIGCNGGGCISMFMQDLGKVGQIPSERHMKVIDMVKLRIRPGENGCVRWIRNWYLRVCMREHDTLTRQCVEIRGKSLRRTEKAHAI